MSSVAAPRRSAAHRVVALIVSVLLLAGAQTVVTQTMTAQSAAAAEAFNAADIISDGLFYQSDAMTAAEIQSFLNVKIGNCTNGQCLNVLQVSFAGQPQKVASKTGQLVCAAVPGGTYSVANFIFVVQQACSISAKVILVTLQKEQGLLSGSTATAPSTTRLNKAMGYACPDTAACDTTYYGVTNQLYWAAWQLKTYKANKFGKQPGNNFIQYNPNAACGGSTINIANYATAALYNYTPYQPNAAAIANLYGTGDGCSAYGNRNFWVYYNSWFGSTHVDVTGRIADAYAAHGGASGWLGTALGSYRCGFKDDGCFQDFQHGSIYASDFTPGVAISGAEMSLWGTLSWENGPLGYPTTDRIGGLIDSGAYQHFQGGSIYTSASTGTHYVIASIRDKWSALSWEVGVLGYPTIDSWCGLKDGGCWQEFQGGAVYWSPSTGTHYVTGALRQAWAETSWENGAFGYPIDDPVHDAATGGDWQRFQGGVLYIDAAGVTRQIVGAQADLFFAAQSSADPLGAPTSQWTCTGDDCSQGFTSGAIIKTASGTIVVSGAIGAKWLATGSLGAVTSPLYLGFRDGGKLQRFTSGDIYSSPSGTFYVLYGAVRDAWGAQNWENGALGYPTSDPIVDARGTSQTFQGGMLVAPTGKSVQLVKGVILSSWWTAGGLASAAGYPTSGEIATNGGVYQEFQNGRYYWSSATGAHFVSRAALAAWQAAGGLSGVYGYPIGDSIVSGAGTIQSFQGGTLAISASGKAVLIGGVIGATWLTAGAFTSPAGAPTAGETCGLVNGGCFQTFEHGSIYFSPRTGGHYVAAAELAAWGATGWERGVYGYPAGDSTATTGGRLQTFQGGTLVMPDGGQPRFVGGMIGATWLASGGLASAAGAPTGNEICGLVGGGCFQTFAGGSIYYSPAGGTHFVPTASVAAWGATDWEKGPMGYPTTDYICGLVRSGCYQHFQTGSSLYTSAAGTFPVWGAIRASWAAAGWERSAAGYPTSGEACTSTGCTQSFEYGVYRWTPAAGVRYN